MEKKTWEDCLFLEGEVHIQEYFKKLHKVLLILGKGFDPRQCRILEKLKTVVSDLTVFLINYDEKATIRDDLRNESRSKKNYEQFQGICSGLQYTELSIPLYRGSSTKKILVISESVRSALTQELISKYENIAIDISAMPRGVGFSIIKRLVDLKAENQKIHILVCENSQYDDRIKPVIVEDSAEFLPGFNTFSMSMEQDNDETVWLPILGLQEENAFSIIANFLKPIEICPVLPFPSVDVRRGERILRSCGNVLFEEYGVERRNIIYVPENYPLLVYKKLYDTVMYYEKAFQINRERTQKYAFSSQSSKLMDIGVLLAMIELGKREVKVGLVVIENRGYNVTELYPAEYEKMYCLCLNDSIFNW